MSYPYSSPTRSTRRTWSWLLAGVVTAGSLYWITDSQETALPPKPTAGQAKLWSDPAASIAPVISSLPEAAPVRVEIPSIGVDVPLTGLARNEDGGLNAPPPDDAKLAGWDAAGIPPGSTGTAVIAAHVDTSKGPAAFYGLGSLKKGAKIKVPREDGLTAHFVIDGVEEYAKDDFPSSKVYGQRTRPELRLITCGGSFSQTDGYSGNVVVYAHLTGAS
ncbi:class F sortase [Streptomyces sp. NPDC032198]|uniref:class F sortase n=1 Tax=Streptomyces sp. NPDC032198 TaxID=3155127 RepID=UPI0033E1AA1C